ncbi:MAG: hypothetical protein RTU92_03795 [Candidatus Thorarchaeota archaeon]
MQDITQFITDLIIQGYLGLFIACFIFNMIPIAGPSNMVLAGLAMWVLPTANWIIVGLVVALSATISKLIHYYTVRGSRLVMSDNRLKLLDGERDRVNKWGALALFIAAASPVPDDPLIIYVGFTKYSVLKLIVSYGSGKAAVTLAGAFIGYTLGSIFESTPIILGSIALTLIITGFLFRPKKDSSEPESHIDIEDNPSGLSEELGLDRITDSEDEMSGRNS